MDSLLDAGTSSSHRFARSSCAPPRSMTVFSNGGSAQMDVDQRSEAVPPSSVGVDRSVELADDEVRMLTTLADTLLARLKASYEAHAFASHLRVDKKQWKAIKKREQLTVYKQKGAASASEPSDQDKDDDDDDANTTPTTTADSSEDERADANATTTTAKNKRDDSKTKVPQLMLTGSVAGRVEDALYGLSSATSLAMKFRSSYTQDAVVDAQVLTTIQGPTVDDPFRFLGLKWALQNHASSASPSTSLFKKRDVVFLESTGLTTLQSGDVVGFHIVHSVHLNSRARMLSINSPINSNASSSLVVRAKTSMGHLFRQRASGGGESVDVFMRGYYDPSGGMLHFLAVNLAAEMLLHTATSSLECAQLKKLSWAAHQNSRKRRATTLFRATQTMSQSTADRDTGATMLQEMAAAAREVDAEQARLASKCAICSRKYGKLLTRGGAACTICAQMVCSRCSVAKKLSFTRHDDSSQQQQLDQEQLVTDLERSGIGLSSSRYGGSVTGSVKSKASSLASSARRSSRSQVQQEICQKAMNFCIPCIVSTTKQSAAHVAVEEILEQQAVLATACMSATTVSATPRQVLAMAAANLQQQQQHRRRTTRAGSVQPCGGATTTTPRFTYQVSSIATTPASTAITSSRKPRPKAFSTSSTSSSTTSSVILYEEPTAIGG